MSHRDRWANNAPIQTAIDNLQAVLDAETAAGNVEVSYWAMFVDCPDGVYETSAGCDNPLHKLSVAQAADATAMAAVTEGKSSGRADDESNRGHVH